MVEQLILTTSIGVLIGATIPPFITWLFKRFKAGGKQEQQVTTNSQLENAVKLFSTQLAECARDRAALWDSMRTLEQKITVLETKLTAAETRSEIAEQEKQLAEEEAGGLAFALRDSQQLVNSLQIKLGQANGNTNIAKVQLASAKANLKAVHNATG